MDCSPQSAEGPIFSWDHRFPKEGLPSGTGLRKWRNQEIVDKLNEFKEKYNDTKYGMGQMMKDTLAQSDSLQNKLKQKVLDEVGELIFLKSAIWVEDNLLVICKMVEEKVSKICDEHAEYIDIMVGFCMNMDKRISKDNVSDGDINELVVSSLRVLFSYPFSFYKFCKIFAKRYEWYFSSYYMSRTGPLYMCFENNILKGASGAGILSGLIFMLFHNQYELSFSGRTVNLNFGNILLYKLALVKGAHFNSGLAIGRITNSKDIVRLFKFTSNYRDEVNKFICCHIATLGIEITKETAAEINDDKFLQMANKYGLLPEIFTKSAAKMQLINP